MFRSMYYSLAERVGFEPTVPSGITGFQDRLLKPLGHLSESLSSIILPCRALFVKINLSNFLVPAAAQPKQQAHQQRPWPGVPAERQISGAC